MTDLTIALAIEARITQIIHTISANAPRGAIGRNLWEATHSLRERIPALQSTLAKPSHIPFVSVDRDRVADARIDGFHIPPFDPRDAFERNVPPPVEGARLIGIAERVHLADIDTVFLGWANGADSPGRRAAFGANLVDQFLGLKPTPADLPFLGINHPAIMIGMVGPFAKDGAETIMKIVADVDGTTATLAAARIMGHYEAAHRARGQELLGKTGLTTQAFAEILVEAAMTGSDLPLGIQRVEVPNLHQPMAPAMGAH